MPEKKWSAIEIISDSLMVYESVVYKFDNNTKTYIPVTLKTNWLKIDDEGNLIPPSFN